MLFRQQRLFEGCNILIHRLVEALMQEALEWAYIFSQRSMFQRVEIGLAVVRADGDRRITAAQKHKIHQQARGAAIRVGSIGKTSRGRDIPYVLASRPLVTTPQEARRLGRPVVYIQGNIHAGEVEGKGGTETGGGSKRLGGVAAGGGGGYFGRRG